MHTKRGQDHRWAVRAGLPFMIAAAGFASMGAGARAGARAGAGASAATQGGARIPVPGISFSLSVSTKIPIGGGATARGAAGARRARAGTTPAAPAPSTLRVLLATGRADAAGTRLDFLSMSRMPSSVIASDYVLVLDSGRAVIVHPKTKTFTAASPIFGGVSVLAGILEVGAGPESFAGTAYRAPARGSVSQKAPVTRDGGVTVERLGPDDPIGGYATQHYVVTTQVGLTNRQDSAQLVTELWTASLPFHIADPFDLMNSGSGLGGSLHAYYTKLAAATRQIGGVPLRTVTTLVTPAATLGLPPAVDTLQRTSILSIRTVDVDPKSMAIPDGFVRAAAGAGLNQ